MKLATQIKHNVSEKELYQDYLDLYNAVKIYFKFVYGGQMTHVEDIISHSIRKPRNELHIYSYVGDNEDWSSWERTVQIGWDNSSVGLFSCLEFEYDHKEIQEQITYYENKLKELEDVENSFENVINNLINKVKEINYV